MSQMRSLFFAPVWNERIHLPRFLEELRAQDLPCDAILLVNNGSTDGSEEMVRKSGFSFVDLNMNHGVGGALIVALDWAFENGFEIFGALTATGKTMPSEMGRLVEPILNGQADFVCGSRFMPGGSSPNLPVFRRRTIPLVNRFVRAIIGVQLTDATCGYRAYKLDLLRRAQFDWRAKSLQGYGLEYYFYAKALLDENVRCKEVPVTMRYPGQGYPYSKIQPGRDWYDMLKPWVAARFDGKGFNRS